MSAGADAVADTTQDLVDALDAATPKERGQLLEAEIVDRIPELDAVDEGDARWHDARTDAPLVASPDVPILNRVLVPSDTPVEIKACQLRISNGTGTRRGRIYIKRRAHEQLRDEDGVYLVTVYDTNSVADPLLAMLILPVDVIDAVGLTWIDVSDDRDEDQVAKLSWSRLIPPHSLEGGDR